MDRLYPDPPARHHLPRCLRSFLLAVYCPYASVVTPWRLASNTLLVSRDIPKSSGFILKKRN
jgi:hypothetical protein